MLLKISQRTLQVVLATFCISTFASASPRQDWELAVKRYESDFQKVAETLAKPTLSKNDQCSVLRSFWIYSENVDYIGQNASTPADQRRISELDRKINQLSKQAKSRDVKCQSHDESGMPRVGGGDNTPQTTQQTQNTNASPNPLFGTWVSTHCENYLNGAPAPQQNCALKLQVTFTFTPDEYSSKLEGREPTVVTATHYEMNSNSVVINSTNKKQRIFLEPNGAIAVFTSTNNGASSKIYLRKTAEYVPTANESVSIAPKANVLPTSEEIFKMLGLQRKGNKIYSECGTAVVLNTDFPDINNDGQPEIFALVKDSVCYGMAGAQLTLFIKNAQGEWQQNLGFPAGGYTLLKAKNKGFPDIAIGLPGMCQPIWRWDGKAYDIFKKCQ